MLMALMLTVPCNVLSRASLWKLQMESAYAKKRWNFIHLQTLNLNLGISGRCFADTSYLPQFQVCHLHKTSSPVDTRTFHQTPLADMDKKPHSTDELAPAMDKLTSASASSPPLVKLHRGCCESLLTSRSLDAPLIVAAMSSPSLATSSFSDTPAADRVFDTVELAETILSCSVLSFSDLHSAMRVCKTFCIIIKTSRTVLGDRVWISGSNPDETLPPFKEYLSFRCLEKSKKGRELLREMFIRIPMPLAPDKLRLGYEVGATGLGCELELDTIIKPASLALDELWRRLPITDMADGTQVEIYSQDKPKIVSTLSNKSTLGDLYNELMNASRKKISPLKRD